MDDLVNISIADAGIVTLLGYAVVFIGLILLMAVIMIMGSIMVSRAKKAQAAAAAAPAAPAEAEAAAVKAQAPGTAGELKLYDTDPRDAAMVMAIVADALGKPLNQLRFKSIKEVKEDEV